MLLRYEFVSAWVVLKAICYIFQTSLNPQRMNVYMCQPKGGSRESFFSLLSDNKGSHSQ